jgi:predicted metal-dependent peptidase
VKELFEPKLNWRQILRRFVGDTMVVGDVDWGRRDRRFRDVYLPLHREKMLRMAIAVDTSGSIGTKELGAFFSEINGILNADGKYDIILLQCDARVHDVIHIVYPEKLDMDSVVIKGRGGTDFRPVFEWLKENNEQRPVIYLTDLCGTFPEAFEVRFPVLWVQVGDEKVDVPFGEVVRLEVE